MASVPERLIDAATRLFAAKGFDRVAVQEIVDLAGVTKGAMYHYFGSKDDLLHEIYGSLLRMQTERLVGIADGSAPVAERLRAAAVDVVVTSVDNFDQARVYFRSADQLAEDKRREVRAERRRYHERFRSLVEEGQEAGVFRADVPADLTVHYFFGTVHHLGQWYSADGPLSAEQVGGHFADLLLGSLRPA
ncbi:MULTISPECIES: TetR/AcrR family transcriptional regulator [Saccharothrix]|uniref:TetR family transcriptional regulator n=2 Tax=Saccharothrix TaxID=2071 RepID=A0ABU0XD30_9PSEU|nr:MULTISPECIES: TetR/AcrR family transcriptional regulator [Saccharothrix]MDQ2588589.1 TetR family transcriptional regulator [Saccharothrix yanglingensis]MDR6591740.1 AcrR family transcriptional regulator [Saccharothrix longispora]MDU0289368.1 TetR/AcrR family transcriptional regulator [Saccharothrix longispora]